MEISRDQVGLKDVQKAIDRFSDWTEKHEEMVKTYQIAFAKFFQHYEALQAKLHESETSMQFISKQFAEAHRVYEHYQSEFKRYLEEEMMKSPILKTLIKTNKITMDSPHEKDENISKNHSKITSIIKLELASKMLCVKDEIDAKLLSYTNVTDSKDHLNLVEYLKKKEEEYQDYHREFTNHMEEVLEIIAKDWDCQHQNIWKAKYSEWDSTLKKHFNDIRTKIINFETRISDTNMKDNQINHSCTQELCETWLNETNEFLSFHNLVSPFPDSPSPYQSPILENKLDINQETCNQLKEEKDEYDLVVDELMNEIGSDLDHVDSYKEDPVFEFEEHFLTPPTSTDTVKLVKEEPDLTDYSCTISVQYDEENNNLSDFYLKQKKDKVSWQSERKTKLKAKVRAAQSSQSKVQKKTTAIAPIPKPSVHLYICNICDKVFDHEDDWHEHNGVHHRPKLCRLCGFKLENLARLMVHVTDCHNHYTVCAKCAMIVESDQYESHYNLHTCSYNNSPNPLKCIICKQTFITKDDMGKHEAQKHKKFLLYSCFHPNCKEVLHSKFERSRHSLLTHINPELYKDYCVACFSYFPNQEELLKHIKDAHFMKENFPPSDISCIICYKTLGSKKKLINHLKRVHKSDSMVKKAVANSSASTCGVLQCRYCDKMFTRVKTRSIHLLLCHDVPPFSCHICDKSYFSKAKYDIHLDKHTRFELYLANKQK